MVTKHKLDNGLTLLLEPIEGVVSVSVGLWIKSGSRDEREDQYGYAHFVEHMLYKGTDKYTAKDIATIIDRAGGQQNAATNKEYTCFYINIISDYLELAVQILSDMFYNSIIDNEELNREKNVIMEEIRMYEDAPDELIHDLFIENMFTGHPLSHSILGTPDSIKGTTRDKLVDFYSRHYINSNAVFVIAGNIDEKRAEELVNKYFSKKNGKDIVNSSNNSTFKNRLFNKHVQKDLEQIHFCLGTEGIKRYDDDRWALYILSTILGGSMSSRLYQNIREKEGLSYSIYSFHSSFTDNGIFGIYCATSPGNYKRALSLIINECREILNNSITDDEFQDTKTYIIGNLALSMESVEIRMGQLAKNELVYNRYFSFDDIVNNINNISHDDFRHVAQRLFSDTRLSLLSLGALSGDIIEEIDLKI